MPFKCVHSRFQQMALESESLREYTQPFVLYVQSLSLSLSLLWDTHPYPYQDRQAQTIHGLKIECTELTSRSVAFTMTERSSCCYHPGIAQRV